jgi:hypothetical protein
VIFWIAFVSIYIGIAIYSNVDWIIIVTFVTVALVVGYASAFSNAHDFTFYDDRLEIDSYFRRTPAVIKYAEINRLYFNYAIRIPRLEIYFTKGNYSYYGFTGIRPDEFDDLISYLKDKALNVLINR